MTLDRQALIDQVEAVFAAVEDLARDLSPAELCWEPAGGGWTIMQILAHVGEAPVFFIREVKRVKVDPTVKWGRTMAHEGRVQTVEAARAWTLPRAREQLRQARLEVVATLRDLRDADLRLEAEHVNPKFGRQSMAWLVEHFIIEHLSKHAEQIRRNLREQAGGR